MESSFAQPRPVGYRVVRYGPQQSVPLITKLPAAYTEGAVALARPGDFLLTHSNSWYGKLIRFGESIKYWGADRVFAHWSHAAIFVNDEGYIIEALDAGVQKRNISAYTDTEYVVVHLPEHTTPLDRQQAVQFAEYCLNSPYGWLTILNISFCLLTGARFSFGMDGQQICSALAARCLERVGEIFPGNEPWHLMPADLAKHFDVRLVGEKGKVPERGAGVIAASRPGARRRH